MPLAIKRTELQGLAKAKLNDAILLAHNKRYSNAYYLAGYAVEIGLKACISRQFVREAIPDRAFVTAIYEHQFKKLVNLAGLTKELQDAEKTDNDFAANWALASEWGPDVRYTTTDSLSCQTCIDAITDPNHGVFAWIKRYW